ncbi:MAG: DUF4333 domain-containing protein [Mycobacterium sp.]|nr:DUF4333 domain-containing protein [Mycobacterium sp.]
MSTPRDVNQPPWPQRPDPWRGYPPPSRTPWGQPPPAQWHQPPPPAQWQQPPPPGQWGQPPPGQWGQPSPPPAQQTPKKSASKSKPWLIGGAIAAALVVVVLVVLMVSGAVAGDTKKVAVAGVQTEVQQVLLDRITGYNDGDITNVRCNDGQDPTVKKGRSFTCDVTVRGQQRQLKVTFEDDNGTYEVGLPELSGGK